MLLVEAAIHDGNHFSPKSLDHHLRWPGMYNLHRAGLHIGSSQHFLFKDHCRIPHQNPRPRITPHLANITSNCHSEFTASRRQLILHIAFASDGNLLIISTEDGRVIRVFHVKPVPSVLRGIFVGGSGELDVGCVVAKPWHVYNLRRGRTSAVVDGISASEDGRWSNGQFVCWWLICMVVSLICGSPHKVDFTARYKQRPRATVNELEEFLLPQEDFETCNPLSWWAGRRSQFRNVSFRPWHAFCARYVQILARMFDFLRSLLLGSAVAVKRIFSGGRDTISLRRASLNQTQFVP